MKKYIFIVFIFLLTISCSLEREHEDKITIILSKASKNYIKWLSSDSTIILDAYKSENIDSLLNIADGIVLTGGEDINPLMYSDTVNIKLCGVIDNERDTLEKRLYDFASSNKIPLLGVCRGMQMINVLNGGTLYGDLPTQLDGNIKHRKVSGNIKHKIV